MEKINITLDPAASRKLKKSSDRDGNAHEEDEEGKRVALIYESKPDKKQVNDLWNQLDDMDKDIDILKDTTLRRLSRYKKKWLERMNAALRRT